MDPSYNWLRWTSGALAGMAAFSFLIAAARTGDAAFYLPISLVFIAVSGMCFRRAQSQASENDPSPDDGSG